MEVNPIMSGILAIVVYVLGLIYKKSGWKPDSAKMVGMVLATSVLLGLLQAVLTAQFTPLPAVPAGDWAEIVFVYVPKVLGWFVAAVVMILSFSQGIYFGIKRVLFGEA